MRRRRAGFTLVEVLITLVITFTVLMAATSLFNNVVGSFKQQTRQAQSGMEAAIGFEVLRKDLAEAGFGLPFNPPRTVSLSYEEASGNPRGLNDAPDGAPRAILALDEADNTVNRSDYLVVKGATVARTPAAGKWTRLDFDGGTVTWTASAVDNLNLGPSDKVIVVSPGAVENTARQMVANASGSYWTPFGALGGFLPDNGVSYLVYGITSASTVRMPFNRADYHVDNAAVAVSARCAPGTGNLVKRVVSHADGRFLPPVTLMECVADMQVSFGLDNTQDGVIDNVVGTASALTGFTAKQIRQTARQVRVYVLYHNGQYDPAYTAPQQIYVGDPLAGGGRTFDLGSVYSDPRTDRRLGKRHYRWMVQQVVVDLENVWNPWNQQEL